MGSASIPLNPHTSFKQLTCRATDQNNKILFLLSHRIFLLESISGRHSTNALYLTTVFWSKIEENSFQKITMGFHHHPALAFDTNATRLDLVLDFECSCRIPFAAWNPRSPVAHSCKTCVTDHNFSSWRSPKRGIFFTTSLALEQDNTQVTRAAVQLHHLPKTNSHFTDRAYRRCPSRTPCGWLCRRSCVRRRSPRSSQGRESRQRPARRTTC